MSPSPTARKPRRRDPVFSPGDPRRSPVTLPEYRIGQRPANAGKRYPAEVYRADVLEALLSATAFSGRHWRVGARDRALIAMLWRSGLRIGEALSTEPKDIDLADGIVSVLSAKGRGKPKRRTVPIDRGAQQLLERWLEVRGDLLEERGDPKVAGRFHGKVFCVLTRPTIGRQLGDSCFRETLKHLARKADLRRRIHPHALRHTFASEIYYLEGATMADLQNALGHTHASTTDRYIHPLVADRRLLELLRERPWPDRLAA